MGSSIKQLANRRTNIQEVLIAVMARSRFKLLGWR